MHGSLVTSSLIRETTESESQNYGYKEHFQELKYRLLITAIFFILAFITSYYFATDIYNFLLAPLASLSNDVAVNKMIYTKLTEVFFTYVKLAFYTALFVSFPMIACQFYIFLAPALYKKEKKTLLPFLIASPILFFLGAFLVYNFIFPLAWEFLAGFQTDNLESNIPIKLEAKVSEYLILSIQLIFAFGIAFQLPLILLIMIKVGIIDRDFLVKNRKYAVIFTIIIAAILTPPDIISQIGLAIALLLLYELSIILSKFINK
ncbi:MAG: twin-arginine translocase subunit TatC [Pseudomonadota bacterium]